MAGASAAAPQLRAASALQSEASGKTKVSAHAASKGPLLPIGEGAYQNPKAVAQRTTDKTMHCEDGKWEDCMHTDKSDLLDGHSYGNIKEPVRILPKSGVAQTALYVSLFAPLLMAMQ